MNAVLPMASNTNSISSTPVPVPTSSISTLAIQIFGLYVIPVALFCGGFYLTHSVVLMSLVATVPAIAGMPLSLFILSIGLLLGNSCRASAQGSLANHETFTAFLSQRLLQGFAATLSALISSPSDSLTPAVAMNAQADAMLVSNILNGAVSVPIKP